MKKIYSLATIMFFALAAQAQVTLGLRGGTNLSSITHNSEYPGNPKFKFGATGGVYATIAVNKNFAVQPELLYTSQGYKQKESYNVGLTLKENYSFKTDYLSLPILAKYKLNNGVVFELGPQISYLLEGQINDVIDVKNEQGIVQTLSQRIYLNDEDLTHDFDFAGVVGVGYQIKGGYSINARYTYGFTNFIKTENLTMRNQYFSLTVGIPFTK